MIIYTGRFQPFHCGHLGLVHTLVEKYPKEIICLAIVKDVPLVHEDAFDCFANTQLARVRNPFNSSTTLQLINKVLREEQLDDVVVTLIPRPSSETWPIINCLFDCDRTWVFTRNINSPDEWEERKCEFFLSLGEKIERIDVDKAIEGIAIRNAINQKNLSSLSEMLPHAVLQYILQDK